MGIEYYNLHNHDSGFGRFDWNYYTDASVDQGARNFRAAGADGISRGEILDLLKSGLDYGKITEREARQVYGELARSLGSMTPEVREYAETVMNRLEDAYPGEFIRANFISAGHFTSAPLLYQNDEQFRARDDYSNLEGDTLESLMTDLEDQANPFAGFDRWFKQFG